MCIPYTFYTDIHTANKNTYKNILAFLQQYVVIILNGLVFV